MTQIIVLPLIMIAVSIIGSSHYQSQIDDSVPNVIVVCAAESQDIMDAFVKRGQIAGVWGPEIFEGNCYQGIADQLSSNLQSTGKRLSIIQEPFDSAWETPDTAMLTLYTTMSVNGAPLVNIIPSGNQSPFEESILSTHMQGEYGIYVPNWDEKIGAANFITGIILFELGDCGAATAYFELASSQGFSWYTYTEKGEDTAITSAIHFYRANCAILNEDFEKAVDWLTTAFPPDWPERSNLLSVNLQANLAYSYFRLGQTDNALNIMNKVVKAASEQNYRPFAVNALAKRAQLYLLVSNSESAIADIESAIELDATNPELYTLRGQIYLNIYEWDKSLADYNTAIELAPDYAEAYFQRGVLYYSILQTGQELREEALADFRHYLELAPDGPHAEQAAEYIEKIEAELAVLNG